MALARVKTWGSEILTAADLNAEIDNLLNNALSLISPLPGDLAFGGYALTGLSKGTEASPGLQFTGDTNLGLRSSGNDILEIVTAGADRWQVNAAGHLLAVDDNTYDIGASGATRPRNAYLSGDLTVGDQLIVTGTGPHSFGGAVFNYYGIAQQGTFAASGGGGADALIATVATLNIQANSDGYGLLINPTLVEAASGVHVFLAGAVFEIPVITGGVATATNAATVYIRGGPSATVTGANYAFWSDAGLNRFDGDGTHVFVLPTDATDPTSGGGAATGRIPVSIGGSTRYLAYY